MIISKYVCQFWVLKNKHSAIKAQTFSEQSLPIHYSCMITPTLNVSMSKTLVPYIKDTYQG